MAMAGQSKQLSLIRGFGSLIIGIIAIILMLSGCAPKQSSSPAQEVTLTVPGHVHDPSLSPQEVQALHTKGQIDKDLPNEAMQDVAQQYKNYLRKGRAGVCAVSKRSEQYLAYARQVFRDRGMPEELANLAIVESGYRPNAVSSAGAAGAWQFMPGTGAKYGLIQDSWQDERFDPYKATEAAADYLQALYSYFGDWPTAIAAYNAGEGKMSRALAGTGGKDFFEVKARNHLLDEKAQLRDETKQYVPRFLAVTKIMRNLSDLGFEPIHPDQAAPVQRLTVAPGTDLAAMSKACALPWSEFNYYNQHHKRTITCTDKQTNVYVPERVKHLATAYLASSNNGAYSGWKFAKVKNAKDSLEKISSRSQVSVDQIMAANPGVKRLKIGQVLLVPPTAAMDKAAIAQNAVIKNSILKQPAIASKQHVIKEKDTLYSIARKYNVKTDELMACNNIKNASYIHLGQTIKIPDNKQAKNVKAAAKTAKTVSYTVKPKDNFWSISRKLNVSVNDLKRWNKIDEKSLKPGSTLIVAEE